MKKELQDDEMLRSSPLPDQFRRRAREKNPNKAYQKKPLFTHSFLGRELNCYLLILSKKRSFLVRLGEACLRGRGVFLLKGT